MVIDFVGCAGDLGELGAVRNQGIFDAELVGDPVTVGFDPVLQLDLRLREGEMVGIAAGTAREGLRVAGETFTQGGREGANEAVVAFTEVDALEDRGLGVTLIGGFGDLEYEDIAANFKRRPAPRRRSLRPMRQSMSVAGAKPVAPDSIWARHC